MVRAQQADGPFTRHAEDFSVVLSGSLENTVINRFLAHVGLSCSERAESDFDYYRSLYRKTPEAHFQLCATFLAICEKVYLPRVPDFFYSKEAPVTKELESLGLKHMAAGGHSPDVFPPGSPWADLMTFLKPPDGKDIELFAALVLRNDKFADTARHVLRQGISHPEEVRQKDVRGITVDAAAHHHLSRLLLQMRTAQDLGAPLVLTEDEVMLYAELSRFLSDERLPSPFDLPDVRTLRAETFGAGLLSFNLKDDRSIVAIRKDPLASKYAEKVRGILKTPGFPDSERALVRAMQEARDRSDTASRTMKVLKIQNWVLKPLAYVPVLGTLMIVASDIRDAATKWMQRGKTESDWYLISAKMQEIALNDYLERKSSIL